MKIVAAAVQLKPQGCVEANLRHAEALLLETAEAGAQLVVLPENFAHYGQTDFLAAGRSESDPEGPVRQFLAQQAKLHGFWLVGGTIPVAESKPRSFARSYVVNPQGETVAHYDKIHLFDVDVTANSGSNKSAYRESDDFSAGHKVITVPTDLAVLGLTVCYDLRFAELYQKLTQAGAQIITVPSAFTAVTGKAHWQVLLRARAIENQLFVIGANMVDREHKKRGLWGGSAIVDPWGNVLASLDDKSGVAVAEIDLALIEEHRAKMPVAQHRTL
jgi:predicted amidohydrolase